MRASRRLILLAGWLAATAAWADPVSYTLDADRSFVQFELLHFGTSTIRGRIGPVNGTVVLDRAAGRGEIGLRVPTASVSTGFAIFDARIREPDLLATAAFPEAYFVATRMRFDGDGLAEVRGEFTLRGGGRPLSLRALHFGCRNDVLDAIAYEVCGGAFEGEIDRSDFGITFGLPFVGNRVRLLVDVQGRRATSATHAASSVGGRQPGRP